MNNTFRKYLPYAAAVVLFVILTLVYFKPLFSGKALRQDDISRHRAMSKEIMDHREKHGEEPLWTNSMFGGMPAYQISTLYPGNWLGALDKAFKLFLPPPASYFFLYFLGFYILLLCLRLDPWLSLLGAVAYGLSSYFLIILEAGHNSKANALGYLPALVGGVLLLFDGRRWLGMAVVTLFTAMELNANHVQISYYGYILIGIIIVGYGITALKEKTFRGFATALGLFILCTIIGVLPNTASLLTTYEYGQQSIRGPSELTAKSIGDQKAGAAAEEFERNKTSGLDVDYATRWSYGIGETFTFLIPDFKGGASNSIQRADPKALKKVHPDFRQEVASSNSYFGDQPFTSGPVYIGAIVVFLAFLGMFIVKHPLKWPVFVATVLTIMLGWGSHFMPLTEFFLHNVPGYNKFRAVAMIMVIAELTLPLIAALAIHRMLQYKTFDEPVQLRLLKKTLPLRRVIIISGAVVGGFCLLCYLAPDLLNDFTASGEEDYMVMQYVQAGYSEEQVRPHVAELMPQLEEARKAIVRSDAIRSAIFIALALLAIYLFFTGKIKKHLFLASLGLFIAIDLWTVANRYLNDESFISKEQNAMAVAQKSPADEEILSDPTLHYRVFNLNTGDKWADAMTSYYHKSIGGYHGAKLRKYQELIDHHLNREIGLFYRNAEQSLGSEAGRQSLMAQLQVINMLNTRYLILPGGDEQAELPLLNPQANGNAWFIEKINVVADADEEIRALGSINTKEEAVMQRKFMEQANVKASYPANGSIRLTEYAANRLKYVYDAPSEVFAVFSEIYYPLGWNAYVDGQLKPHVGVNYVLRGMPLPAGNHTVEFRFEPRSYSVGNTVAAAGSALVILLTAAGFYMHRRNKVIVS